MKYLCPTCRAPLELRADRLTCVPCGTGHATVVNGVVEFDGCIDKESFFEKQAMERLETYYADYSPARFRQILEQIDLWEMDWANKRVGITTKYWWEPHIGRITGKRVLQIGCGVNYQVPSFLLHDNHVLAFDICKGSVDFLRRIIDKVAVPTDKLELAVADATRLELGERFDIVGINNVLHHVEDKRAMFERAHRHLKDDGKLIMVEPNYYYPPRWMIETEVLDPFNPVKDYFVRNDLIEKGEKAIIFPEMRRQLAELGFKIDKTFKDPNYLGYFTVYWVRNNPALLRAIFELDKHLFSRILPAALAPFQYIIASKA